MLIRLARKPSNWDRIPSTHPEKKGALNWSPKKNWIDKKGGLPNYIRSIAMALMREKGYKRARAIATAVNQIKRMARGYTMNGKVRVSKAVQAAAAAALAKWNAMKVKAADDLYTGMKVVTLASDSSWNPQQGDYTIEQWRRATLIAKNPGSESKSDYALPVREPNGTLNKNAVSSAIKMLGHVDVSEDKKRSAARTLARLARQVGIEVPESLQNYSDGTENAADILGLTDKEMAEYLTDETIDESEGGDDDNMPETLEATEILEYLEREAVRGLSFQLPVVSLADTRAVAGKNKWVKQVLRAGKINYNGRIIEFTQQDLQQVVDNFKKNALDYVPFQFVTDDNRHSDSPKLYGGKVVDMRLADNGNSVEAVFELGDDAEKIVQQNPQFGVSVAYHPNYIRTSDETHFGPTVFHVAGTHRPKLFGLKPWEKFDMSLEADETGRVDLTAGEWDNIVTVTTEEEGEVDMADVIQEILGLASADNIDALIEAARKKLAAANTPEQKEAAQKQLDALLEKKKNLSEDDNTEGGDSNVSEEKTFTFSSQEEFDKHVQKLADERAAEATKALREQAHKDKVSNLVNDYKKSGVPPAIADLAEVLLARMPEDADKVLTFSDGDQQVEANANTVVRRILDNCKNMADLSEEEGSTVDNTTDLSEEDLDAGADQLLGR